MTGIYKITSQKFPDRVYIGSAINIKKRWQCHLSILSKNKHHSPKLQGHVNKYGIGDLKFTVLLECEKAELLRKEQCFINIYSPSFNICKIAGSQLGQMRTNSTKEKCRQNQLGRKLSNETKLKMSRSRKRYLQEHPEEIERLKQFGKQLDITKLNRKGKTHTKESIEKMRKPKSKQHRENIAKSKLGELNPMYKNKPTPKPTKK